MGMFSEIATESTVHGIVIEIRKRLETEKSECCRSELKSLGRFALTQFEWSTPDWAKEFEELFRGDVNEGRRRNPK